MHTCPESELHGLWLARFRVTTMDLTCIFAGVYSTAGSCTDRVHGITAGLAIPFMTR